MPQLRLPAAPLADLNRRPLRGSDHATPNVWSWVVLTAPGVARGLAFTFAR